MNGLLLPLAAAFDPQRCGGKAASLARLRAAGFRTPAGVVLQTALLQEQLERNGLAAQFENLRAELAQPSGDDQAWLAQAEPLRRALLDLPLWPELMAALEKQIEPGHTWAVRSSAPNEDGPQHSFAGQFDTVLGCRSVAEVAAAVRQVWASLLGRAALAYARQCQALPGMAVIIQHQVAAVVSGVLFTRDPRRPEDARLVVEYCAGLGARLVGGEVTPGRMYLPRYRGDPVDEPPPEEQVPDAALLQRAWPELRAIGLRLEALQGGPQDVEWSLDATGHLHVLQSRPITALAPARHHHVWSNANIAENFPDPVCPLLRSFVACGYAAYFRGLGMAFGISSRRLRAMDAALDQLVGCHGGRLYYNLTHIHTVLYLAPGGQWLAGFFNQFTGAHEFPVPVRLPQRAPGRLLEWLRVPACVLWRYLRVGRGLRRFEQRVDAYAAATTPQVLEGSSARQLAGLLQQFLTIRLRHWTPAALADTAAMVCYGSLQLLLRGRKADPNDLLKGLPGLASAIPVEKLWDLGRAVREDAALRAWFEATPVEVIRQQLQSGVQPAFAHALDHYLRTLGFRSSGELQLSKPTPREDPLPVLRLLKSYVAADGAGPAAVSRQQAQARSNATRQVARDFGLPLRWLFRSVLHATQGSIRLRERARMKQALLYTRLRLVALALGQRLVADGLIARADDVLFLEMDEVMTLARGGTLAGEPQSLVASRREQLAQDCTLNPPDTLVLPLGAMWVADEPQLGPVPATTTRGLMGTGACGGRVSGAAAVVLDVADIDRIRGDEILVTRQTDPGWAAVFFMIRGLVIERGGLLSHGAIIAREYGIPAVVGVRDATRLIQDGEPLCVDGDQGRVYCGHD